MQDDTIGWTGFCIGLLTGLMALWKLWGTGNEYLVWGGWGLCMVLPFVGAFLAFLVVPYKAFEDPIPDKMD